MKVLIIISGLGVGGTEAMLLQTLKVLDPRYKPTIISLSNMGEIGKRIRELGIPVHVLAMRPGFFIFIQFYFLVRLIQRLQPDIVHTWMYHADLIGGLAARLAGVRAIAWALHNTNLDKNKTKWTTRLVVRCSAMVSSWVPDRILSCSNKAIELHTVRGYPEDKMIFIPNGIDTRRFHPNNKARNCLKRALGISDDAFLIGLVGRYDPLKNHEGFIDAAGIIHKHLSNVHFILAGQGVDNDNSKLKEKISTAGLGDSFHLLGLRDDMPELMASLDVLVSASHGEAFPLVLGEAMACGVPCVATDVGDSEYIVGDTGVVIERGDMQALAFEVERLLRLPASERAGLGMRARERIGNNLKIGQIIEKYQDFYDELAECGRHKGTDGRNIDFETVEGFGHEWRRFDQSKLTWYEHKMLFDFYFFIFPWKKLPDKAEGFDLGCGSGRWAKLVAPRVGRLHCIDPSSALDIARTNLAEFENCIFHLASVSDIPLENSSMDFGYSLGVLHHVPDTQAGINECVKRLKPGAPFLIYLYYTFDNRPWWFRMLWGLSDILRRIVSKLPYWLRYLVSQVIAMTVYWPLARRARYYEKKGVDVRNFPLSSYRNCSFYTMRTDALDRFGTRLEKRFTRAKIKEMLEKAGLEQITFSEKEPFWTAVGFRRTDQVDY